MIRFDQVSFRYQRTTETSSALEEVSFCLRSGETVALAGANGSGKSTLALLAGGLLRPTAGRVLIGGVDDTAGDSTQESLEGRSNNTCYLDTAEQDPEIHRRVGFLFQSPDHQTVGITVEEDLAFGLENLGVPREEMETRLESVGARFGLRELFGQPVATLSGGTRQKLALAGVMAMRPSFLILDEPTSQLDPWARAEFWGLLRDLKAEHRLGILFISQRPDDLEQASRLMVLHQGRLVLDQPVPEAWHSPTLPDWGVEIPQGVRFRLGL